MRKIVDVRLAPEEAGESSAILAAALRKAGWGQGESVNWEILKRSIDARKGVVCQLRIALYKGEEIPLKAPQIANLKDVHKARPVHIIGAGPAGYSAALQLIELGLKPVIFDRGKDVRARRRDLRAIQQFSKVNPDSNYCFGEGGAGTYSDGKLYTRSTKRGDPGKILRLLVEHGASEDILIDAHPHIGSNKLPTIVSGLRETIVTHGGEVHFGSRLTELVIRNGRLKSFHLHGGEEIDTDHLILATGHSARDIYLLLHSLGLSLESKPFALGVRIEHPQRLIDSIQYGRAERGDHLPAASYQLACNLSDGKGVFSFCMCPGGMIVPAATAPGEIVLNGMSLSRRDSAFANAGTVVSVGGGDFPGSRGDDPLIGLQFQAEVEKAVFHLGDGSQKAPAQRLLDFLNAKVSADLPDCSYIPGIYSASMDAVFPAWLLKSLRQGIRTFGKRMHGYLTNEAVVLATESRTSSPIRIPRSDESLMHPDLQGLYPCGEGAGYAGGIMSAAMDGQRVAQAVFRNLNSRSTG